MAINQPLVDLWSWWQSDVAVIARDYFQNAVLLKAISNFKIYQLNPL